MIQGNHNLTAGAYDNLGNVTVSAPVTITINSGPNAPTISIAAPATGSAATATSAAITVTVASANGETITFLHNDFAGSAIAATDATGNILWKENYTPFGDRAVKATASSSNRQWFTGKPVDVETGLSNFGGRMYDPVVGRFMGVDAVGFQEGNLHSFNRYAYGNNNPYKYVDLDGRESVVIGDRIMLRPQNPLVPSVSLPNNVGARGLSPSDAFFHTYTVDTPSSITNAAGVGQGIANSPTPGPNNLPASPMGTINNAGAIPTLGDTNLVRSYSMKSPDSARYTDITVNYTISGAHGLRRVSR
jgi:RHS repeat-associated protein